MKQSSEQEKMKIFVFHISLKSSESCFIFDPKNNNHLDSLKFSLTVRAFCKNVPTRFFCRASLSYFHKFEKTSVNDHSTLRGGLINSFGFFVEPMSFLKSSLILTRSKHINTSLLLFLRPRLEWWGIWNQKSRNLVTPSCLQRYEEFLVL